MKESDEIVLILSANKIQKGNNPLVILLSLAIKKVVKNIEDFDN